MLAEANRLRRLKLTEVLSGRPNGMAARVLMVFRVPPQPGADPGPGPAGRNARSRATLRELPDLPRHGQWAIFLRNHDEVDLGRLTDQEAGRRSSGFFAPDPNIVGLRAGHPAAAGAHARRRTGGGLSSPTACS